MKYLSIEILILDRHSRIMYVSKTNKQTNKPTHEKPKQIKNGKRVQIKH